MTSTAIDTAPVWVLGARGMLAGEFLRLLEGHPVLRLAGAVTREPDDLARAHPHLAAAGLLAIDVDGAHDAIGSALASGERAAVVVALPHGESAGVWLRLEEQLGGEVERLLLVDLAADFRLRDPDRYRASYGREHPAPETLAAFTYGLPELVGRDVIARSARVAAPGCFATAMQLAVFPAAKAGLLDTSRPLLMHAVTGSSGSGNVPGPGTHHPHRDGNLWAYALDGHRHEAELEQALEAVGVHAPVHLSPHSGPFVRGIHLAASLPLAAPIDAAVAQRVFADFFAGQPFVRVLSEGVPDLRSVVGSNTALVRTSVRGPVLTVLVTLDNLLKGGAGQALQCLNLMLGLAETSGLPRSGMGVL